MSSDQRAAGGFRYPSERNQHVAWPLGGVGAPLLALTGAGGLDRIAIRHRPDVSGVSNCFAALSFPGRPELARVLEGQVPRWKVFTAGRDRLGGWHDACCGGHSGGFHHGLPRLGSTEFTHRFPFASVDFAAADWPVAVSLEAWSPFVPSDAAASGMPVAALTWRLRNPGAAPLGTVFSFHCRNELLRDRGLHGTSGERIRRTRRGFAIDFAARDGKAETAGGLAVELDGALADCAWFRGDWFDAASALWKRIQHGAAEERRPHADGACGDGASLWLPLEIPAGGTVAVTVRLAWYEPASDQRQGGVAGEFPDGNYRPHYATRFGGVDAVADAFHADYAALHRRTRAFADALHACDIAPEALEAVTANLGILRSPTVLRQHDGRLWGWEGCCDLFGACHGSCTHVWNYAQAVAHLFPALERGMRQTEFGESQDERGHQNFRCALPIRPTDHGYHAAADGQFGGIVKLWRDWQISGDTAWLRRWWPHARRSLEYCIATWDPDRTGALVEPHHNTYDIEFWGPDGMCGSVYAAALQAAAAMAESVGDDPTPWRELQAEAVRQLEGPLFRRGRFVQLVARSAPRAGEAARYAFKGNTSYSSEAVALLEAEGPKYQYGEGVLSDGVIGAWMARIAGLGSPLDPAKERSHLAQVHRHNLRRDLAGHACAQRPGYANGSADGGLLLCSWPDVPRPTLPFVYSDEVWTGIEYQVASHCILVGLVEEGLEIVRIARARYDGTTRNPFDEYECGHWYARALASWALLPALTGLRYSAVERTLFIAPRSRARPFRMPLFADGAFGSVVLTATQVQVTLAEGSLAIDRIVVDGRTSTCAQRIEAGRTSTFTVDT